MKTFPVELRERVFKAVEQRSGTIEAIAKLFSVSQGFIYKLLRQWREIGSVAPKPHAGGPAPILDAARLAQLRQLVQEQPDATLEELQEKLRTQAQAVASLPTLCRALQKLKLKRKKKKFFAQERDPKERRRFVQKVQAWEPHKVVFIDEMGININLSRQFARSPAGASVTEALPGSTPVQVSVAGALNNCKLLAICSLKGAFDGAAFGAFMQQMVAPHLKPGDLVAMDNVALHKSPQVDAAIKSAGAHLLPMPIYSPDLDPLEPCWSKIKTHLRKVKARTLELLYKGLAAALWLVTPSDIRGWFAHCGYNITSA
jgi:transposase